MKRNKLIEEDLNYITNQDLDWEQFRDSTVLISGAAGFFGAYIVDTFLYLNETKNLNVSIFGMVRNLAKAFDRFKHYQGEKLSLIQQDVCDPISWVNADYIIHTASPASPKVFTSNPVETILPNIVGTNNLLKLAVEKKVKGFLFFSTSGVYGYNENYPVKEDDWGILDPTQISSCYLESKRMGENLCLSYMREYDVPVKIVRPSITYGYGVKLDDGRSYADFIRNILNKEDITLFSDGQVYRNFCYVADAVAGIFFVMLKGEDGQAYNLATDQEVKIFDLAKLLVEEVFPEYNLKVVIKKDESQNFLRTQFSRTQMDITKLKSLGWELNFPINEGFRRTILIYKEGVCE